MHYKVVCKLHPEIEVNPSINERLFVVLQLVNDNELYCSECGEDPISLVVDIKTNIIVAEVNKNI